MLKCLRRLGIGGNGFGSEPRVEAPFRLTRPAVGCERCLVHGEFETERLTLRPVRLDDLFLVAELNRDAEVMMFITGKPSSIDETATELGSAVGNRWLAFTRRGGQFVGWVGAVPSQTGDEYELGWRLARSAWGHGYATESARALVDRLFGDGARRVFAQTMAVNARSRAVMERVGLRFCRRFVLDFDDPLPGTELGEVEYELLRTEWRAGQP